MPALGCPAPQNTFATRPRLILGYLSSDHALNPTRHRSLFSRSSMVHRSGRRLAWGHPCMYMYMYMYMNKGIWAPA